MSTHIQKYLFEAGLFESDSRLSFADISPDNFDEFQAVMEKVANKKSPSGMSKEMDTLKYILKALKTIKEYDADDDFILGTYKRIKQEIDHKGSDQLDNLLSKLLSGKTSDSIKTSHATFINSSIMADKVFKERVNELESFLKTLKSPHNKTLGNNLVVRFVRKEESKSSAKYKRDKDEIYLRPDRKITDGDGYGSFVYVLLHELGHRYEESHNTKEFESVEWITTPYSMKDTLSGNEHFAELFALSHWPEKYPKYQDQIKKFLEKVK